MPIQNPDSPATELSARNHIAIAAMQGVLASGAAKTVSKDMMEELARFCFRLADVMIEKGS